MKIKEMFKNLFRRKEKVHKFTSLNQLDELMKKLGDNDDWMTEEDKVRALVECAPCGDEWSSPIGSHRRNGKCPKCGKQMTFIRYETEQDKKDQREYWERVQENFDKKKNK